MKDLELIRRAAEIAANTKCWIGIGCVIAKDGKILAEAWNETIDGEEYCREFRRTKAEGRRPKDDNVGCVRHELRLKQGESPEKACSIHAEILAIIKSVQKGKHLTGSSIFITSFPCLICMRAIIASGIKRIVYMNDFYKPHHEEMFTKNGIKTEQITEDKVWRGK